MFLFWAVLCPIGSSSQPIIPLRWGWAASRCVFPLGLHSLPSSDLLPGTHWRSDSPGPDQVQDWTRTRTSLPVKFVCFYILIWLIFMLCQIKAQLTVGDRDGDRSILRGQPVTSRPFSLAAVTKVTACQRHWGREEGERAAQYITGSDGFVNTG